MSATTDLARQVTYWLHTKATAEGTDRVLAASLARAAQVRQEHRARDRSLRLRPRYLRPVVAASALAIAVIVLAVSSVPPLPRTASAKVTGVWPTGPGVVFTALLPPDAPPDIYWRGAVFDTWSTVGRAWHASADTLVPLDAGGSILDHVSEPITTGAPQISVSIVPHQASPFVVAPGLPVTVDQATEIETSGPGGPLVQVVLPSQPAAYRITAISSAIDTRTSRALLTGAGPNYPADIRARYAAAPDAREFGPESAAFLRAVHDVAGDDPYAVASAMVDAFQSPRFAYRVDMTDVDCGNDGFTECFLRVKRGYCMYFATAMVMLLRHEGTPARFVQGFLPGERIATSETVRTSDAHAWVEVYFPAVGWVTFDPTPLVARLSVPAG